MKWFKTSPKEEDGLALLMHDIRQTTIELNYTYDNLENALDPDMIDYYIYRAKAMQVRYRFLLNHIKKFHATPEIRDCPLPDNSP